MAGVKSYARQRWKKWLATRIKPNPSITLDQRRIYVFPTKAGALYAGMLLIMLITAINYQNNSIFLLTFFLAGLFNMAILAAFSNLAGLSIRRLQSDSPFAGNNAAFHIELSSKQKKQHQAIQIGWPNTHMAVGSLGIESRQSLTLYCHAKRRGLLKPQRMLVKSVYPLGLIRAWSWVDLDLSCPIYPHPIEMDVAWQGQDDSDLYEANHMANDELANIRHWREGDTARQVLWKAYARTDKLMSIEYAEPAKDARWLDWDALPELALETRLSVLCDAALKLHEQDCEYGLRLPACEYSPDTGATHLHKVLEALALFSSTEYQP
jgi:uncharacterized protein (DUF58 family)